MNGDSRSQPEAATPYQHVCSDVDCCYHGQPSFRGCGCYRTREQMMSARIEDLTKALEFAKDYVDRAIASYVGDPADNQFQRGHLAALEVVRDEAFSTGSMVPLERSGGAT